MGVVVTLLVAVIGSLAWGALREARAAQRTIAELRFELAALRSEIWSLAAQLKRLQQGGPAPETEAPAAAEAAAAPAPTAAPEPRVVEPAPPAAAPPPVVPPPVVPPVAPPVAPRLATPAAAPPVLPTQPSSQPISPPPPPAPSVSLEERLGARAFVWIGAIALALAGAFLVKYSIDQGWIGPPVRLALAVAFGAALLGAGEALRRRTERIASALSAAGIAVLFAAWLAGTNLYHLIPPGLGFALLGLTAGLGVLLALRQGAIVALVGLVGGFLTPALVGPPDPDVRVVFGYLLLLQAGLLAAARRRGWPWLPELALAGGLFWVLAWLAGTFAPGDALWLALFLVGMVAATVAVQGAGGGAEASWRQPALAAGGAVVTMALVTARADHTPREWAFQGVLVAACLVLARMRDELHGLAWLGAGAAFALLAVWGYEARPEQEARFFWTALAIGGLCAAGSYAAHFGDVRPARWTALSAASSLAFFVLAWGTVEGRSFGLSWSALALIAATLYLVAAVPAADVEEDPLGAALAPLAVAATAFVSLAVALELERAWWTVAWALEVPALVWLAGRFRLPVLRQLAAALAVGVAVRLLANPEVLSYPIGTRPVLNWLLYGYGLPLLAFLVAAALARRDRTFGPGRLAPGLETIAAALAFALVTLEVRQGFHPARLAAGELGLIEWATYTVAWLLLGLVLLAAGGRLGFERLEQRGALIAGLGVLGAIGGSGVVGNPLWSREAVGATPVVNDLLWIYGAPALLAAVAARVFRRRGEDGLATASEGGALVLLFLLVTLEVRQAYHGIWLDGAAPGLAEWGSYVVAWLLLGLGLHTLTRRLPLRSVAVAGALIGALGLATALAEPGVLVNPLWNHEPVGATPVVNLLLWVYGVPALLAALTSRELRRREERGLAVAHATGALVLLFLLVTLEVAQAFHGTFLDDEPATAAEKYAYSAAWLLFGILLLVLGIARRVRPLRYASLAVTGLAIVKVFLFDTGNLTDLYRVLSFLGLGISLLLLAYLYQRFVFREPV